MKNTVSILVLFLILLSCSSTSISGNSSETGNCKIIGIVSIGEETPAAGVPVVLAPADYRFSHGESPDTIMSDLHGRFEFPTVSPGNWTISSQNSDRGFIRRNISLEAGDSAVLDEQLLKTGTVKVTRGSAVESVPVAISGTPWGAAFSAGETELYLENVPTNEEVEILVDTTAYTVLADSVDTAQVTLDHRAVIITGTGESNRIEQYRSLIEAEGLTLSTVEADTLDTVHVRDAKLVIILGTPAVSESMGSYLRECAIPVMNSAPALFPILDMTGAAVADFGTETVTRFNTYTDYNHPVMDELINYNTSAGYSVEVIETGELSWGKPGGQAAVVGVLAINQSASPIFCYEKGADMITVPAPARRVGIFANGAPLFISGEQLYRGALQWLLGRR